MTDKEKIKEEIENQINFAEKDTRFSEPYREGLIAAYQTIKAFIDSLPEEHNEDLEEEIEIYSNNVYFPICYDDYKRFARHFTEWQEKQMLSTAEAFYEQGRFEQKQQMMKDAVEGVIDIRKWPAKAQVEFYDRLPVFNVKTGDKVKIVVLKTE